VQRALDALGKSDTPTASQQADQKFLTDTLSLLDSIDKEKSKAKTQSERLRTLPTELKEIGAKLDALTQGKSPEQLKSEYATMSLAELDARQPEIMANMQAAQEALGTIGSQITNLQTLPERAQASMSRAYQRSQEIRTRLNAGDGVSSAEKMKLNAELALLDLQLANLQRSWTTAPACRIWWSSNGTTRVPVSPVKSRNCRHCRSRAAPSAWGHREDRRRDRRTGGRRRQPLVQKEQELNYQLSQQLISSTNSLNTLAQKNLQAKSMLERGTQTERNLNEQVQMLRGNLLLSRILYQLYQQLEAAPSTLVKNLEEQIADLHLAQFELSQQRDQLFQKNQYLDNLIASSGETVSDEDRPALPSSSTPASACWISSTARWMPSSPTPSACN
jgi:potassium efflux system protein